MKASTGEVNVCPDVGIKYRWKAAVGWCKLIRGAKLSSQKSALGSDKEWLGVDERAGG